IAVPAVKVLTLDDEFRVIIGKSFVQILVIVYCPVLRLFQIFLIAALRYIVADNQPYNPSINNGHFPPFLIGDLSPSGKNRRSSDCDCCHSFQRNAGRILVHLWFLLPLSLPLPLSVQPPALPS